MWKNNFHYVLIPSHWREQLDSVDKMSKFVSPSQGITNHIETDCARKLCLLTQRSTCYVVTILLLWFWSRLYVPNLKDSWWLMLWNGIRTSASLSDSKLTEATDWLRQKIKMKSFFSKICNWNVGFHLFTWMLIPSEIENWKPQFNIFPESLFSQNSNVDWARKCS